MTFLLLSSDMVELIHHEILNPGELTGRAHDKSLQAVLARAENRLVYGLIDDSFELAAAYGSAIARTHCFNDGNKRTAHQSMDVCLDLNGIEIQWDATQIGNQIILAAQGLIDEVDLAEWLRSLPRA